jgi:hypothetical protein
MFLAAAGVYWAAVVLDAEPLLACVTAGLVVANRRWLPVIVTHTTQQASAAFKTTLHLHVWIPSCAQACCRLARTRSGRMLQAGTAWTCPGSGC